MILRRGQEEIVGFIIIVVIVALAGVAFLGFSLMKQDTQTVTESYEVTQLLNSMMQYTTNCSIGDEGRDRMLEMTLIDCSKNNAESCISGQKICDAANESALNLLEAALLVTNESSTKGYLFNATYESVLGSSKIIGLAKGDCNGSYKAADEAYSDYGTNGKLRVNLKICS
jgi:hypothetical protein